MKKEKMTTFRMSEEKMKKVLDYCTKNKIKKSDFFNSLIDEKLNLKEDSLVEESLQEEIKEEKKEPRYVRRFGMMIKLDDDDDLDKLKEEAEKIKKEKENKPLTFAGELQKRGI
jgi:hypothetical protein